MAFDSLTEKLQNVFKNLRSKGRLTEEDVKAALKEVKMALLEADVNFKVVKDFIKTIQERAVGQDVMNSLTPGQMVGKLKPKGRNPLLVGCDIYRPAAIEQLKVNAGKQGVEMFSMGTNHTPANIAKAAIEHAVKNSLNVVIPDTAG